MKIDIHSLTKSFGENHVLRGIDLQAQSGKAVGILGRNGAGKTTTIRIIMGVFPPDSGEILVDDKPIHRAHTKIGYLPEERGLYPKKVIIEQLTYFGMLKDMNKKDAAYSAEHWLTRLQMIEHKDRRLETLSKGNQQKIQLAVTLIANPDIIILDEPFSGLDPVNAMLLKDIVKELIDNNKIVLFSSHQMNYIEEFCDDIAILNHGKIAISGSTKEIKRSYDRDKILISSPDLSKIKQFLQRDPMLDESIVDNNRLIVKLKSVNDKGRLLSKLTAENFDIDEIKVYEPSLNDIFVEYTGDNVQ